MLTDLSFSGLVPGQFHDVSRRLRQHAASGSLGTDLVASLPDTEFRENTTVSVRLRDESAQRYDLSIVITDSGHGRFFPVFAGTVAAKPSGPKGRTNLQLEGAYRAAYGARGRDPDRLVADLDAVAGLSRWFDQLVSRLRSDTQSSSLAA
jgi:hypothetical protein